MTGKLEWSGDWIADIDCFLHLALISKSLKNLHAPTGISMMHIDPKKMTVVAGEGNFTLKVKFNIAFCDKITYSMDHLSSESYKRCSNFANPRIESVELDTKLIFNYLVEYFIISQIG